MSINCKMCPYPMVSSLTLIGCRAHFHVSLGHYCYVELFGEHNKEVEMHFHCMLIHFYSFSTNIYKGNVFVSSFQEHFQKAKVPSKKVAPRSSKAIKHVLKIINYCSDRSILPEPGHLSQVLIFHFVITNYQSNGRQDSDTGQGYNTSAQVSSHTP